MEPFKFYLITDTHYFASKLGCHGEAYKEFMTGEQKCYAETEAINKAAFKWLNEAQDADTVLIAGDLSFNGEKESHLEFIELLKALKKAGKRIFVITAGHDFNDHPFCFDDEGRHEPEGTKREELFDLYYEYGFEDAIAVDRDSLSYVAQLCDGVRLLALNNDGDKTESKTYTARQIEWILEQTKKAREDGQMMIAMNHYPLVPANPIFGLVGDAVMKNADYITSLLADEGVHLAFTGHMHNQSIKMKISEHGNRFWDVCTGSLIGCPASMRLVTVKDKAHVDIKTLPVPEFEWDMEGLTNDEYFTRQFDIMINTMLDAAEHDPARILRKVGMHDAPAALEKLVGVFGKAINNATLGDVASKLHVKAPESIKEKPFRELALEIVRNMFLGNAPFVEGTDEYEIIFAVLKRLSPVFAILSKTVKVGGKPLNVPELVKYTVGHYGVDENNTELTLC